MSAGVAAPALIWLVDDSRTQVAYTEHALGSGYLFERFVDGPSVIRRAREATRLPDLVLLDWTMPGMSGDEVCRVLRGDPVTCDLALVLFTASRTETQDVVCAFESGANDYVAKPFVPEELRARVGAILRASQLKRAAERERRRATTVNKLGRALLEAGSDVEQIVQTLATALTETLCDGCVALLLPGTAPGATAIVHRTARGTALLPALAGITDPVVHRFHSTEQALAALPASHAAYVHGCALRGLAVMAIPVRGLAHGVVTLTRDEPSDPFDASDLATIQTCLEHTGLALEAAIRSAAERATTRFHEEMLGIVGHDLRSPLAAMTIGIELLRQRSEDPASGRVLARLERSARRMASIIEQLLDVTRARIGTGIPVVRRATELYPLIAGVLDELRLGHGTTTFELHGVELRGAWDGDRLAQVVSNLASNAAQYGRAGGPVTVTLSATPDAALISIRNELRGAPIPEAQLATLFDAFQRGGTTDHAGGLGLGLYIVQEIVRAHGGTISATSSLEGTVFQVALPYGSDGPELRDEPEVHDAPRATPRAP